LCINFDYTVCTYWAPFWAPFFSNQLKNSGHPGANPTIAGYNASVVNFYNATGSLARFENKNIFIF
jgi:hypothetical protein